jgi:hypothetical protein
MVKIAEYQSKVLEIAVHAAVRAEVNKGAPDAAGYVSQGASDLISLSNGKDIVVQLEQCCLKQKNQIIKLEDDKLESIPGAYKDASVLFDVCMKLSNGLTSIRNDLADMIREV